MLEDVIKELKDQIAAEEKPAPEPEPEKPVEPEPEPEKPAEPEPEPKKEPEEEPDASAYARMRREKAAAEKKAADLEARLAALESKPAEPEPKGEADTVEVPPEIEELVRERRMTRAEREFQDLEMKFKEKVPDYDGVAKEYVSALASAVRIQNPRLNPHEITEKVKETVLLKAANYMRDGFNPIEELYHEAKDLGFKAAEPAAAEKEEKEIKPDMKKVAENRKKSTGMSAATGEATGQITKAAAAELSVAEWAKLPKAEKLRLLSS